jgi:DNA (cytosine-5)-methyltransferase 1
MKYLSVCSGIEAASAAWHSLGWRPVGFSEIEPFPCSVLEHRFPDVKNFGDMTKFKEWDIEPGSVDVLVGGTPCQSFSIAGLRGGLTDGRGNLALTYCQILQKFRPRWFIWENVPGVLSSNGGRDFGSILGAMVELGYGIAYRILDAQYFGVPQRRRRVFVVGCAGDWRRAAAVLFESGCVSGDTAKSRKAKQNVAALTATGVGTCGADDNQGQAGHLIPTTQFGPIAGTLTQRHDSSPCADRGQNVVLAQAFRTAGDGAVYHQGDKTAALTTATDPCTNIITTSTGETAHCLNAGGMGRQDYETETMVVAFSSKDYAADVGETSPTLRAMGHSGSHANAGGQVAILGQMGVRRLTPRECERLQGFPDDWTLVTHRGKPAADGPRYKAIGNSMAVPVMRWIGKRIELV